MAQNKKRRSGGKPKPKNSTQTQPKDYTQAVNIEKMTEQVFRRYVDATGSLHEDDPHFTRLLDMDPVRRKHRQAATIQTMDKVRALVQDVCPDIEPAFYIEEEWAEVNALPLDSYDLLEENAAISLAAAIWMLDRIRENRKLVDALELLPDINLAVEKTSLPEIYDPCFNEDILYEMLYTIRARNSDCTGIKSKDAKHSQGRVFADAYTAAGKQHQPVPSRERFEALLALIDPQAIQDAVTQFEEALWAWVREYFTYRAPFAQRQSALTDECSKYTEQMDAAHADMTAQQQSPVGSKHALPLSPAGAKDQLFEKWLQNSTASMQTAFQLYLDSNRLQELQMKLREEVGMLQYDCHFGCNMSELPSASCIRGFEIADPYAICFALLYLMDTDSALPWLYYPGCSIVRCAAVRLPWYFENYDPEDDPFWPFGAAAEESPHVPRTAKAPEKPDWYALKYTMRTWEDENQTNLAQMIYELTGCILPRNMQRYDAAVSTLARYGVTGKKMLVPLLCTISMLGESRHQLHDWRWLLPQDDEDREENESKEETPEPDIPQPHPDELALIRKLKEENSALKKALHAATSEARTAKEKLEEQTETWQLERQELQDFRELFFRQGQENESTEPVSDAIHFPYVTKKRTVVFGGHDTWAKAIKPMLPEVRFVMRDAAPNPDLIRHADVVWIQSNALAHKHYYKIMDVARTYHIPVRYFGYASAEKCAEQLVLEDEKP